MRSETWKPIPSFPGYEASDHGRVRSFWAQGPNKGRRGGWHISDTPSRIMAPQYHRLGYPRVNLGKNGKPHKLEVSRLVLLAFIGPCPNGMEVCHNDGNPSNNRLDNLRYDTHSGNMIDAVGSEIMVNINSGWASLQRMMSWPYGRNAPTAHHITALPANMG